MYVCKNYIVHYSEGVYTYTCTAAAAYIWCWLRTHVTVIVNIFAGNNFCGRGSYICTAEIFAWKYFRAAVHPTRKGT